MNLFRYAMLTAIPFAFLGIPQISQADFSMTVTVAPPELPVYEQPEPPDVGYRWVPGYWAYGPYGYYWVPGTWVLPPQPGYLWTPGYWGWSNNVYVYNEGYWGRHVGFYGGINYGYGYGGSGYVERDYSSTVTHVTNITNVTNVTNVSNTNNTVNASGTPAASGGAAATTPASSGAPGGASVNGGPGGTTAAPTPQEKAVAAEPHIAPTSEQTKQVQMASQNKQLLASNNHGRPPVAATAKPGVFSGKQVVAAKGTSVPHSAPPANRLPPATGASPSHPMTAHPKAAGNPKHSQKSKAKNRPHPRPHPSAAARPPNNAAHPPQ